MPKEYKIKPGDTVASFAKEAGIPEDKIWNDSANSNLKKNSDDPNILRAGDTIVIPDLEKIEVSVATDSRHSFVKKIPKKKLNLQLLDEDDPRAGEDYILKVDGQVIEGTTDAEGKIEEDIPADATSAKLIIGDEEIPLMIGEMEPITELKGVQMRLNNLSYPCGNTEGDLDDETKAALKAFQAANNLKPTGEADKTTQDKLTELHGC